MAQQHESERPSDRLAKRRYSLPDRLKPENTQSDSGFSAAADYRERQRKKREAGESD